MDVFSDKAFPEFNCSDISVNVRWWAGLQENIVHGQAPGLWPLKMYKPLFCSDKLEKIHFKKCPHIKIKIRLKILSQGGISCNAVF